MLQLQVDGVEIFDFSANLLNVAVGELAHPAMAAAQKVLVEIEHRHIEDIAELVL